VSHPYNKAGNARASCVFSLACFNTQEQVQTKNVFYALHSLYISSTGSYNSAKQGMYWCLLCYCVCVCVLLYALLLEDPVSRSFLIASYYMIPHLSPDLYCPIPTASYPSSSVASPLLLYSLLCASSS